MTKSGPNPKDLAAALKGLIAANRLGEQKVVHTITHIPPPTMSKILDDSPELAATLNTQTQLNKAWADILHNNPNHFFGREVEAIDHTEKCTVLDQFLGTHYISEWLKATNEEDKLAYLNKACEVKMFEGFVGRIELNFNKITHDIEPEESLKQLFEDINHLSNLYWLPGTVHGVIILNNLSVFYGKQMNEQSAYATPVLQAGLELALTAAKLYEAMQLESPDSIDHALTQYIHQGKDLKATTHGVFESFPQVQRFFLSKLHLSTQDERFKELDAAAEKRAHPERRT